MKQATNQEQGEASFQHFVSIDCSSLSMPEAKSADSALAETEKLASRSPRQLSKKLSKKKSDSEERIYRIDQKHDKFLSSHLLQEPRLHVSVKASQSEAQIELDQLIRQKKAVQWSQGREVQQIVVSTYESIPGYEDYQDDNSDIHIDPNSVIVQVNLPGAGNPAPSNRVVAEPEEVAPVPTAEVQPDNYAEESAPNPNEATGHIEPAPANPAVKPAWEVVAFRWPAPIRKLCSEHRSSFKKLLTSLQLNLKGELRRIGVVNSARGQGSTTLATCIAKILADAGQNVLLSDLDLEHPGIEEVANIQLESGWQKMLDNNEPISEFLVRDSSKHLTLMPLQTESNLVEKRSRMLDQIRNVSEQLSGQFDYSVFDIGNAQNLMVDENCHVGFLDGVVIVSDTSSYGSTAVAIYEKLIAAGVPAVAIAENFRSQSRTAA